MSGYRSYVPWSKGSSSASYSSKKESAASPKYESSYSRSRPEAKKIEDKSTASAMLGSKYGAYGSGYQRDSSVRDTSSSLSSRSELPTRYKSPLEKKDSLHPPVSYRPLTRTASSRSRDPSPVDRDKTESSSSGSYNLNRLYPRPYTRSASRERNEGSTIPKYTGRSSITKDEIKYPLGRTSRDVSKEDLSSSSRYKSTTTASRTASREDLSSSPKYITSRFLPKNTIEKSYTAYSRPSTSRTSEVSRKNRELLNVLSTQNEDRSRPVSRCSSITADDIKERPKLEVPKVEVEEYQEMESVMVVTRSTSPNLAPQSNLQRARKVDNAKLTEKLISRPLKRPVMLDKEIQSDRLDDTSKSSRFAGASRIAAPWSSYLDLKYSSPGEINQESDSGEKAQKDSPKSVSRNNSSKSLSNSSSKFEIPSKIKSSDSTKSKLTPPKSLQNGDLKKQLPPQVPSKAFNSANTPNKDFRKSVLNMNPEGKQKKKSTKRSNSASSADSDGATSEATEVSENLSSCKSFPKSSSISKLPQRASQEPTSESQRSRRSCTRSPSLASETSSAPTSSSEDDGKAKLIKPESKLKKMSVASSRTISSVDELSTDKSPKPPLSPRMKTEGPKTEAEAKSFLMRALAPVTNLFKSRPDSSEKSNWLDNSSDNISEIKTDSIQSHSNNLSEGNRLEEQPEPKRILCKVSSGENSWWFEESEQKSKTEEIGPSRKIIYRVDSDDKDRWLREATEDQSGRQLTEGENLLKRVLSASEGERRENWFEEAVADESKRSSPSKHQINRRADLEWSDKEGVEVYPKTCVPDDSSSKSQGSGKYLLKVIRHVDSGEKAWWLEENAEVPEGVEVYPAKCVAEDGSIKEGRIICPVRKDDSDDKAWWLDDNENVNDTKCDEPVQPELFQKYKIRHIDSGERAWWLSSSENIPEITQNEVIRHQSSGEKLWWQDDESGNEFDCEAPLGDRASPEGLETPREDEARGRLSPYDNVHVARAKVKRPDNISLFISKHTNIDDILGGSSQLLSPLMSRIFTYQEKDKCDSEEQCQEIDAGQVRIHDSTPQRGVIQPTRIDIIGGFPPKTTSYGKVSDSDSKYSLSFTNIFFSSICREGKHLLFDCDQLNRSFLETSSVVS